MKLTEENIKTLLRDGIQLIVRSDDYRYSELEEFARLSAVNETQMILVVGDNITFNEARKLAKVSCKNIVLDASRE